MKVLQKSFSFLKLVFIKKTMPTFDYEQNIKNLTCFNGTQKLINKLYQDYIYKTPKIKKNKGKTPTSQALEVEKERMKKRKNTQTLAFLHTNLYTSLALIMLPSFLVSCRLT